MTINFHDFCNFCRGERWALYGADVPGRLAPLTWRKPCPDCNADGMAQPHSHRWVEADFGTDTPILHCSECGYTP